MDWNEFKASEINPIEADKQAEEIKTANDIIGYHAKFISAPCTHEIKTVGDVIYEFDNIEYQLITCSACGMSDVILRIKQHSNAYYQFLEMVDKHNKEKNK